MLNLRKNKGHKGYKILAVLQIFMLLFLMGCSNAGVSNGSIRGTVFSNRAGGSLSKTPEPGVNVVAVFDGSPEIIRTEQSDGNGQYSFSSLPVGKYTLGFLKDGFEPITTEKGTSRTQTAIGEGTVRVFVETGSTVTAADVTLVEKAPEGDGTVIVNVIDRVTGDRVDGATVTVGTASTNNSSNGQYVLTVSVQAPADGSQTAGEPLPLTINAEGYATDGEVPSNLPALAGQTVAYTITLPPVLGSLEGQVSFEKYDQLYDISQVKVTVDGVPDSILNASVGGNGFFSLQVPVRTATNQRSYTLRVTRKGFLDQVANNILGPIAGSIRVDIPPLVPETVTIVGTVENPFTQFPAVVVEAGLEGGITGGTPLVQGTLGTYSIDGVPTNTDQPLTVKVITYQFDEGGTFPPDTNEAEQQFTATNNGTGVYRVANISAGGGGN